MTGKVAALLDRVTPAGEQSSRAAHLSALPVLAATPLPAGPGANLYRAENVAISIALTIPAMRRARNVLLTPATFELAAWQGSTRLPATDPRCSWLRQPDPSRTRFSLLARTLEDGLWHDRSVWHAVPDISGRRTRFTRVHPSRWDFIPEPLDPDTPAAWIIDGRTLSPSEFARDYLTFDFAGLGGLQRLGFPLLALYADLMAAAGNYARSPMPAEVLRQVAGADLTDKEIDALLDRWQANRAARGTAWLGKDIEREATGFSARDLQLTEAREHAALEVARLVGLPAFAVDAQSGDSMTYGNTVDRRRDMLEALRPWMSVITDTLSLDDRTGRPGGMVLPSGITARFDSTAYTRDDPQTRMATWAAGIAAGVITRDEARAAEPLAWS